MIGRWDHQILSNLLVLWCHLCVLSKNYPCYDLTVVSTKMKIGVNLPKELRNLFVELVYLTLNSEDMNNFDGFIVFIILFPYIIFSLGILFCIISQMCCCNDSEDVESIELQRRYRNRSLELNIYKIQNGIEITSEDVTNVWNNNWRCTSETRKWRTLNFLKIKVFKYNYL